MTYSRYAVYFVPTGPLAAFGAAWLGWDVEAGTAVEQPNIAGLAEATKTPRKYGFHGTLKPPFRLAGGTDAEGLDLAVAELAARTAPATFDALAITPVGRFLALTPVGNPAEIERVAAACVTQLDEFRAPAPPEELMRRRKNGLSACQESMLQSWGYPFVLDEFRFHLTLTGRLAPDEQARLKAEAEKRLPDLAQPFAIDAVAVVGERGDKSFELVQRYELTG